MVMTFDRTIVEVDGPGSLLRILDPSDATIDPSLPINLDETTELATLVYPATSSSSSGLRPPLRVSDEDGMFAKVKRPPPAPLFVSYLIFDWEEGGTRVEEVAAAFEVVTIAVDEVGWGLFTVVDARMFAACAAASSSALCALLPVGPAVPGLPRPLLIVEAIEEPGRGAIVCPASGCPLDDLGLP